MSKEENFVLLIHSATGFMMFNDSAGIALAKLRYLSSVMLKDFSVLYYPAKR